MPIDPNQQLKESLVEINKEPCLSPLGRVVWIARGRDDNYTGLRIGKVYYRKSKNDVDDE